MLAFLRRGRTAPPVLAVFNLTPIPRPSYRIGVDEPGRWVELLNSDAEIYGGSGVGNLGGVTASDQPAHGRAHSISLMLPPLSCLLLELEAAPRDV